METPKKKASRGKVKPLMPIDLVPADYNPRTMTDASKKALKRSVEEFEDISGITWNKKTKNIVTGHHRWQTLIDLHGIDNLELKEVSTDKYEIVTKDGTDTSYAVRVVDWDIKKEKAANIAANSQSLAGSFTVELQGLLAELEEGLDADLFDDLRLSELQLDDLGFDSNEGLLSAKDNEDSWESDIGKIDKINKDEKTMYETIQVLVPKSESLIEVKELILKAMEGRDVQVR